MLLSDWLVREQVKRKDFAARIGVSPSLITAFCNGSVWPSRPVAERIVEATSGDVTSNDFLNMGAAPAEPEPAAAEAGT